MSEEATAREQSTATATPAPTSRITEIPVETATQEKPWPLWKWSLVLALGFSSSWVLLQVALMLGIIYYPEFIMK